MDEEKESQTIRLSALPSTLQTSARELVQELDANGDGCIDAAELASAINALKDSRKQKKKLMKIVAILVIAALLLIGSIFGVSIAAARMAKDTETDDNSGFLYTKNPDNKALVKTGEAITWYSSANLVELSNDRLMSTKYLAAEDGDIFFHVKGHARTSSGEEVVVLVEGGTLTFNDVGLTNATGEALYILETAGSFGNGISNRKLQGAPLNVGYICFADGACGNH